MTDTTNDENGEEQIADAFGLETDPLEKYAATFEALDADPFSQYIAKIQEANGNVEGTINHYRRTFRQWKDWMAAQGRHPACPSKQHIKGFSEYYKDDVGNKGSTVRKKLDRLDAAYTYFQSQPSYPHPTDYDPFRASQQELDLSDEQDAKKPPRLDLDEIRDVMRDVGHVADRAVIGTQLKLGCRSSELCNIRLSEVHVSNPQMSAHYDDLGTHDVFSARDGRENAIYIPADRRKNKSSRPRLVPLDEETRRLLVDWLLVRPDNGDPHLFLSKKGEPMSRNDVHYVWTQHWWPEYESDEDDQYASVSPHFARHNFSTFWTKQGMSRQNIMYLRGDVTDAETGRGQDAIDYYIHNYYEDVEETYRDRMFQFYL